MINPHKCEICDNLVELFDHWEFDKHKVKATGLLVKDDHGFQHVICDDCHDYNMLCRHGLI